MIELYLFLHPLDYKNAAMIDEVMASLANQDKKYKFHLVPTINFQTINHFMSSLPKEYRTIDIRNQALKACYDIALDFETLLTMSRSLAIDYFKLITLAMKDYEYSQALRCEVFKQFHIDVRQFNHRRTLQHLNHKIQRNQQLMHQLHVTYTPSIVLYNFSCDEDIAILLDNAQDFCQLPHLLEGERLAQHIVNYM